MNEEIEKILSRLERIDHIEYKCSFEFADSASFEETCRCFEERKKLANYITTLQKDLKDACEVIEKLKDDKKRAKDRLIEIENKYGYILDDVVYMLTKTEENK